ncbi:MAG: polysaccharide biosynthesis/export family protein [Bryobacteraceae bacterium]|nr:polysaccharide biosynthesis/export family protein [Bryobacteraceae bacterium]
MSGKGILSRSFMRRLAAPLLAALLAVAAYAQRPAGGTAEIAGANLPAQRIGPNDLIAVSVYGAPEFTRTVRVGADGLIRLPMLKQRIRAESLLPAELETAIAAALQNEQLLVDPVVTVTVAEYHSRPISVAGAVRNPVTFQAAGPVTLLEALTRAGGLSPDAGPEILVTRTELDREGNPSPVVQRIPVKALIDSANPEVNLRLSGGEEIRVPEVGRIYVVGTVRKPGAYPVPNETEATVLQLLALAEGLAPFASKQAYIYRPDPVTGERHEMQIELKRIMARKAADVPLQPSDILYIPDSSGRRLTVTALERIAAFGTATASGVLIWRR